MDLSDYLSVPYRLLVYSAPDEEGHWFRFAEYPEIGSIGVAESVLDALDKLEQARYSFVIERLRARLPIPVPRPPLRSVAASLPPELLAELRGRLVATASSVDHARGIHGDLHHDSSGG